MADEQRILKEDGYLYVATESSSITYHPSLNVILVLNQKNEVKVLDVNSGVILQSCTLSDVKGKVRGRYMPMQEKILLWDDKNLGLRGDYNGVLLLDTILQTPVLQNDDVVRVELLLSEAILFQQSVQNLEAHGVECPSDVSNELMEKIKESQNNQKKGIKAQRWNTICLEFPFSSLKMVANNVVSNLKRLDRHIPALAIASAVNERLTDLLAGCRVVESCSAGTLQRFLMYSEAARRQTFEKWPHMDYKWALPDQMAQAGFYHQPSVTGEDRAMCFTCSVCLVCWEKTDEPWSEHERHSPSCPFVKGEYTQNVPLSVTYATNPAVATNGFDVISNSDHTHVLCTASKTGEICVWSIERQLKKMHTFNLNDQLKEYFPDSSEAFFSSMEITALCTIPDPSTEGQKDSRKLKCISLRNGIIGTKILVGFFARPNTRTHLYIAVLDIAGVYDENESADQPASDIKSDITEKNDEPKTISSLKTVLDESLGNDIDQLSDMCPWKFNESKKSDSFTSNYASLEDDFLSNDMKHNTEKLLHNLTQMESTQSKIETLEKLEEISCVPFCLAAINAASHDLAIIDIIPVNNCTNLLIKIAKYEKLLDKKNSDENEVHTQLMLLPVDKNCYIQDIPTHTRNFNYSKSPREICVLPQIEPRGRKIQNFGVESGAFCMVCQDGSLELVQFNNLQTMASVIPEQERFVSLTYCKSLERLCGCTAKGSLIFYSLQDSDVDSGDEIADEDNANMPTMEACLLNTGKLDGPELSEIDGASNSLKFDQRNDQPQSSSSNSDVSFTSTAPMLLAHKNDLTLLDLKALYSLTIFDDKLTPYTTEVPSCWNELVQAQKQRRHPQHLRPGDDCNWSKTWRLHNDATTWDEHVIELTLPKPAALGHIDLKFSLYQQCPNPPAIQVTLLKQNTSGFGYRMKGPNTTPSDEGESSVDESVEFPLSGNDGVHENPVLTDEYLQAHNAEILAGPIELSSCMDLCDQGGLVTLTSPKLFKTRARNFLLHIKTMADPSKDGQGKARGCDWLHEISITVRSTKNICNIGNERLQRIAMLESNNFLENLVKIICNNSSMIHQNVALDILIWIATVRLMRFRSPKFDRPKCRDGDQSQKSTSGSKDNSVVDMLTQQKDCVLIIEKKLKDIIFNCIINGNRTMAHKAVKLILIVSEGVRNFPNGVLTRQIFDDSLKEAIISCIPHLQNSKYASTIRWFTLLASGTSTPDSHAAISDVCLNLLLDVTKEITNRLDPFCSLLGSRFGLYGFPFEPDLFDVDLPHISKGNTSFPNTLVNIIKSNAGLLQSNGMDFKKLSSIDGVEFRSFPHLIKTKSISNQLRGLLEVEPLHFNCFAASEATRIENIDSVSSSTASNINVDDIIVTPLQNKVDGVEGTLYSKKDTEKDNMNDDVMNNVKNILVDKIFCSTFKKHKVKDDPHIDMKANGVVHHLEHPHKESCSKYNQPKFTAICQYIDLCDDSSSDEQNSEVKLSNKIQKYFNLNHYDDGGNSFSWLKVLTAPPKQMIVIDRIHSGARRFVVVDFGFPILLTDVVIPACDELSSLLIDIWCFDEETDCVRLAVTQDIGTKTLVLSDLQPPPICRYMKITIIGRYGMSATKCKIPIGSFYGHVLILDNDAYADPLLRYMKAPHSNILSHLKVLNGLYEDVHCRYSLSSSKLMEVLEPILNGEMSNLAHMQAFINKNKDENSSCNTNKIVAIYEECISSQHQLNVIKSVIERLESSMDPKTVSPPVSCLLQAVSRDKLRVLSESLVEIVLHFSIEYGLKNILSIHSFFNIDVANALFNTLVVHGDAHIQLATCSLLVRMCCFQSWWGEFLANTFCTLFSSQNSKIFPQDRVFFLLTYLGRRSIAMGTCRSIVIDSILKTVAKLVAPISLRYSSGDNSELNRNESSSLWSKSDLQLITWLLLFLSVCLDENGEKKDKSINRWEFMSCEADFTRSRSQTNSSTSKNFRSFKKRIIQQPKYTGLQQYTDWGKKIYMIQNELPEIFMELTGKPKPKISKVNITQKPPKEPPLSDADNFFDRGLKSIKLYNIIVVIRGLIALILEMDFTCNMDLFLLTCKVIARLVSACRPSIQLSKIVTTSQLEQLIRLAVWNDQQQPWAVHAVTCLVQDLLDADKNFKEVFDNENDSNEMPTMENVLETEEMLVETSNNETNQSLSAHVAKEHIYSDSVKYGQLPSLIECEDVEIDIDEFLNEIDIVDRGKNLMKKDNISQNKNSFNTFCKSISSALDSRLDCGLDTNVEISIRRLTMSSSLDMYASLPQIPTTESINTAPELPAWPEYITNIWSGPEYNSGMQTYEMFTNVFDNIFADLHIQDTWVHLEQVLQMWLTLNSELSETPYSRGLTLNDVPKIPFGPNAVQGLLMALAWHNDIKIRTWCLGFHSLILACNSQANLDRSDDFRSRKVGEMIIQDENFEKMLLRFFSGYGMSSPTSLKRCAGPTICKYLHKLFTFLVFKTEFSNPTLNLKKKLKDTLLNVVLQLVQPGGAICNQQGPMDAQSVLVRDLFSMQYDKADLNVAMQIIESVSFLVFNNISNAEKIQCQRTCDTNNCNNAFGSLFATVLGGDNNKQNTYVSDSSLIIILLKLSVSLVQTELQENVDDVIMIDLEVNTESQTDEIKAEQLFNDHKVKVPCVADSVLKHFPTMKRLLGSLSHSCSSSFTLLAPSLICPTIKPNDSKCSLNEPQTTTDAVFHLLMVLCEKASNPKLVVQPIFQYLEANSSPRNVLPRLQLSEPFLLYVLKILDSAATVTVFAEMGGVKNLCKNLIKCNKLLINMQPGLISLIMQHMTRNTKLKFLTSSGNGNTSKKSSQSNKIHEGLINFAPFCTISADNNTAQPAEVLIQTPIASHRRARTPAWSYMFYPNESHVDLTITLPTAVLLKEIQLQPHLPTLATCPAAVALEISRDNGLGSIPFGQPLATVGMTCIRLKLIKPEIATSLVLRLYRPKDSSSIGLTQISILGTTIFGNSRCMGIPNEVPSVEDDSLAKTSIGWIRLLARCFSVATFNPDCKLSKLVISSAAEYPGFLEACCNLMNVMPSIPSTTMQNLETVLINLGKYSKELGLTLIRTLLWNTTPQNYRVTNESVCDLLYDLCKKHDDHSLDKVSLLLDWILKLQQNFSNRTLRCTNPQSGFVKCIASILWNLYSENSTSNLPDLITNEVIDACLYWIDVLENKEPLKLAFDSLLCSFCYIKPEFFNKLLRKVGFVLPNQLLDNISSMDRERESPGITDDNKEVSGTEWYNSVPAQNLKMLLKPAYLNTLALACQSPLAIYQLVDSGLPKLLAQALFEYCCSMSPEIRKMTANNDQISVSSCLTDSDKAENCERCDINRDLLIDADQVSDILDFFSECCSEGYMRDWLGSYQGTIFWKALLELLCNFRPPVESIEPMQQSFIRIERSTVNFLTRVTAGHPKNQESLMHILISVIRKPQQSKSANKSIISGFTRRIVLQLLLENERILVSVRSKMPLQRKDQSVQIVNNHPSKRTNPYHLLFHLSTHTKCQDILQNCASVYSNIIPTITDNSQAGDAPVGANQKNNQSNDSRRELLEGFGLTGYGMEFLSVAAGVTAKDKRLKDVRNQAAALKDKDFFPKFTRLMNNDDYSSSSNSNMTNSVQLIHSDCPDVILTSDTTISQILAVLYSRGHSLSTPHITLHLIPAKSTNDDLTDDSQVKAANVEPLPSPLQRFSSRGGLSLLAYYLPVSHHDGTKPFISPPEKEKTPQVTDWVKLDNEDIYEDIEDAISETTTRGPTITSVPHHSLAAFGLFLRLPAYSDILLRDKLKAQCLLRLVLGVTGDGEGNDIYSLSLAPSLPTLPFEVFRQLLDISPLTTDDGVLLRRMVIEVGAMHLILNCLGIFTHQSQSYQIAGPQAEVTNGVKPIHAIDEHVISDDKSHIYWAKGTGFGTGSTLQSWDVEQALMKQKSEEEHVTVLLQVLSSYINPGDKIPSHVNCDEIINYHEISDVNGELPILFLDLLQKSCLVPALSSYLRNDSVLDITRHIPLYRSILQLLRAISLSTQLVTILQPKDRTEVRMSIPVLLANMRICVDTYAKRLKVNKKSNIKGQTQKVTVNFDDGDDEGLALLIPDIQETTALVQKATNTDMQSNFNRDHDGDLNLGHPLSTSIEQRYLEVMKKLQFDTYDLIVESENGFRFVVSHHFENNIRMAGDRGHPSRVKRLAQEAVTLSTSLPLSYSSSVFVRCDTDRLDIMKVLITGPADTPYANGCFEFDVYFPSDYPNSPMLINLETTGRHSVRFNPNLYNDGKVCLSVLNTWHGRPEEKWNAQTSSFLQVLVSIQSLILVPEPYFNEPGFERSRGTPSGTHCSREYNSNIYQACVRWAMLEQIRNPNPCFQDIIHTHFWLKRNEICTQIENWIEELSKHQYTERSGRTISFNSMVLRRQYRQLREELAKLPIPEGLEDLDRPFNPNVTSPSAMADTAGLPKMPSTSPLNPMDYSPETPSTAFGSILQEIENSVSEADSSSDNILPLTSD